MDFERMISKKIVNFMEYFLLFIFIMVSISLLSELQEKVNSPEAKEVIDNSIEGLETLEDSIETIQELEKPKSIPLKSK